MFYMYLLFVYLYVNNAYLYLSAYYNCYYGFATYTERITDLDTALVKISRWLFLTTSEFSNVSLAKLILSLKPNQQVSSSISLYLGVVHKWYY